MRTTLDIEDDVLAAAKDMARRENLSAGQVISRLARLALTARADTQAAAPCVSGFRPFAARGVVVSNEQVNTLREAEGI
jgi:predicted DNA-binding ribbon-helix-helix protein